MFLENIRDRDAATETYVIALDQQPNNRNLLTKLMSVYSEAHDWARLTPTGTSMTDRSLAQATGAADA